MVEIEARYVGREKVLETFQFLELLGYNGKFIHDSERHEITKFNFEKFQNRNEMNDYCNNFTFETD